MGRMAKNTIFSGIDHALGLPASISGLRPGNPVSGQVRWNTTTTRFEYYNGTSWASTAHEGTVNIIKDSFSGNGVVQTFTMSQSYAASTEANVLVFVGQVYQNPGVAYTFNGTTTITFTAPPAAGTNNILLLHNFSSTTAI